MVSLIPLRGVYDTRLLALSCFTAILAIYGGIDLSTRIVSSQGRERRAWFVGGSVALGIALWAMYHSGLEAYRLPVEVAFDLRALLLSLAVVVSIAVVFLYAATRTYFSMRHCTWSALSIAALIVLRQYIDIRAMQVPATFHISVAIWILFGTLAFISAFCRIWFTVYVQSSRIAWSPLRFLGILGLALALPSVNCVGISGVKWIPSASIHGSLRYTIGAAVLTDADVVTTAFLILAAVFLTALVGHRLTIQQQRLTQSQSQLQTVFDNMKEGIVVLDLSLNIVQINRAAARMLAMEQGTLTHKEIIALFEVYQADGTILATEHKPSLMALRGEFVRDLVLHIRRKDIGTTVIAEVSSAPILNASGAMSQIIISYRDVTDQQDSKYAMQHLAAIVESSQDAIIGKDLTGKVTSWNRSAEQLFGYTAEEMIGKSIRRLVPPDIAHEEDHILRRIRHGETVQQIDSIRRRKDGSLIHVALTISPIRNSAGAIVGASKIARDITEKRQLERQLRQSQKMEAIGQLTGGIAHDFNNLLGVVIGNLDLLEGQIAGNEAALKRVRTALKAATRGADLTRRMLTFSSSDELRPVTASLDVSIRNMIELASRALGPEIRVVANLDPTVPQVYVDVTGLESALLNLAVNARDAMPRGGSITITTQLSYLEESYPPVQTGELKSGHYACVSVSDTGYGMTREILDRVFEPFFTTKPRNKGTGLGLAMVYGFVKQSGGTVRIYSEPGFGTTVSFYLPLAGEHEAARRHHEDGHSHTGQTGTVLVVDDEEDLVEIAVSYLSDMGYTALGAIDGPSALRVLEGHSVDLVLTDIVMPGGMNGVDLAQKIRERNADVRIIYCSGFPADALAERSMELVDGPLLHKPYHRAELAAIVRRVMSAPPGSTRTPVS